MLRQEIKNENGITLVALIITIIVLIILAAVTIMSFKDSNLINTAVNGTINYANAQAYETKIMDDLYLTLSDKIEKIESAQSKYITNNPGTPSPTPGA